MEYCCTGLRNMLSCAGERGNAILVWVSSDGELGFLHQSRGVSFEDELKLKRNPLKALELDLIINISAEVGVKYCPTCGRLLEELVEQHRGFYADLAKEHKKYLKTWQRCPDDL